MSRAPLVLSSDTAAGTPTRRRRWPWVLMWTGVGLAVVIAVALAAVAWYFSGRIGSFLAVPQPDAGYPMTITSVADGRISYTGVPSGWDDIGLAALRTPEGGYLQTGDPRVTGEGAGSRAPIAGSGPGFEVGQQARLDGWFFGPGRGEGLGLPIQQVSVPTPMGPATAWLIPGNAGTWVVYAHGRGDAPAQGLRMARTVSDAGYPMLLVSYRNDAGAPAGNGYAHFGSDEWADLEAAVQYAVDNGAENVVLAGTSMGGSIDLALLRESALADRVVGVFLDAPMTDLGRVVDQQGADLGLPAFVTGLAKAVAAWRFGLDWSAMDYIDGAGALTTPVVVVQGSEDSTVPPWLSEEFARAAPDGLVRYVPVAGAGHTTSWNVDPAGYEAVLAGFLAQVAPRP